MLEVIGNRNSDKRSHLKVVVFILLTPSNPADMGHVWLYLFSLLYDLEGEDLGKIQIQVIVILLYLSYCVLDNFFYRNPQRKKCCNKF